MADELEASDLRQTERCLRYAEGRLWRRLKNNSVPSDPLQQAILRLEEAERIGAAELDLSNLGLGPVLRADWRGWEMLGRLDKLKRVDLSENRITAIPVEGWKALNRLVGLSDLRLHENQMADIPAEGWEALGRLAGLSRLDLSQNGIVSIPKVGWEALGRLTHLERLYLELTGSSMSLLRAGRR